MLIMSNAEKTVGNEKKNYSDVTRSSNLAPSQSNSFTLSAPASLVSLTQLQTSDYNSENISQHELQKNTQSNNSSNNDPSFNKDLAEDCPASIPQSYKQVDYYWFYQKDAEQYPNEWQAFSLFDNNQLEKAYQQNRLEELIPTNGTRFDVKLSDRSRTPAYWEGLQNKVQRCSWFYKKDHYFIPYSENVSELLEETYRRCFLNNQWNHRLELNQTEVVVFYAYNSVYHYFSDQVDTFIMPIDAQPRYIYRGVSSIQIEPEPDESSCTVEHLIFFVHGIGEFCDLSFRSLKHVLDDFRKITDSLKQTHYGSDAGRIEVLPISWHQALHTKSLDKRLEEISLSSINRLRSFTNNTILDALFYTSSLHSVRLLNFVADELNRVFQIFLQRNNYFSGRIALAGHSLGSLILFDLLSCQRNDSLNNDQFKKLNFKPDCLFALGSPLAAFLTVRGIELNVNFCLPTCPSFFNIFHPYDPIAYRIEPLINREFAKIKPVLIPHHKGRKRIHLELKDSLQRVSSDIKEKLVSRLKGAFNSLYGFARGHFEEDTHDCNEQDNVMTNKDNNSNSNNIAQEQFEATGSSLNENIIYVNSMDTENNELLLLNFGKLNRGRRLDYVLQESPIEFVNEYAFAIQSHVCYWYSEDTSLLMLKELFGQPVESNNNNDQ